MHAEILAKSICASLLATATVAVSSGALAQKSADTFRFAVTEPQRGLGSFVAANREGNFIHQDVYEYLLAFDEKQKKFLPQLATSWKQVDPVTYEFELRTDVKFHNGNAFDADDMIELINTAADKDKAKAKGIFNQFKYAFTRNAEKLGPHKIRITVKKPEPTDLMQITLSYAAYDSEIVKSVKHLSEYEAKAVGTGPYKVLDVDASRGVNLAKNADFTAAPGRRKLAGFARVNVRFLPEENAQIANLLAGQLDMVRDLSKDQLDDISKRPEFKVSTVAEYAMIDLSFDAIGRSGNEPLKDARVRRALVMAIDREKLKTLLPGGEHAEIMNAMCFRNMLGCDTDVVPPPAYDPAGAKKLLAEAGYPNGFPLELTARAQTRQTAVAITGFWRDIGVTASIDEVPSGLARKKRASGKLQTDIQVRPYHPLPDASLMVNYFFNNTNRDYWHDDAINKLGEQGLAVFDLDAREKVYKQILDRINTQAYMLPISSLPAVFLHSKDVKHTGRSLNPSSGIGDFQWN